MKYKEFPAEFRKKIEAALHEARRQSKQVFAAFDADGTLWDTDLGEAFFDYLIDNKKVSLPPEPWKHYIEMKKADPKAAYLWLAQICQGQRIEVVRRWAHECVESLNPPIFHAQKELIHFLRSEGVQVHIVTASIKWAVEPGAHLVGLTAHDVLGIETQLDKGVITNVQKGHITYRTGKVHALLEKTSGLKPFFCSGNSEGDQELLLSASHIALAVSASRPDDPLYRTETQLQKLATQQGWLYHRFVESP